MLPGLGFQEILLLGVLALVVIGPKDLPLMLRKIGQFTAKMRGLANEFRMGMDELARQTELDELRKEVDALRRENPLRAVDDQMREIDRDLRSPPPIAPTPEATGVRGPDEADEAAEPKPEDIISDEDEAARLAAKTANAP